MRRRRTRKRSKSSADMIMGIAVLAGITLYSNPASLQLSKKLFILFFVIIGVVAVVLIIKRLKNNDNIQVSYKKGYSKEITPENIKWPPGEHATLNRQHFTAHSTETDNNSEIEKWSLKLINSLEWKRFEELCAGLFEEKGFNAKVTRLGADGGIDINLFRKSYSEEKPMGIVQCKAWNTYKVGVKPIRELYGVMAAEGISYGVFATSGEFTNEARIFADGKNVKLINGETLLQQIIQLSQESQTKLLKRITQGDYSTPSCPSCGDKMILRTTKNGKNIGSQFWGCKHFPRCRSTLKLSKA